MVVGFLFTKAKLILICKQTIYGRIARTYPGQSETDKVIALWNADNAGVKLSVPIEKRGCACYNIIIIREEQNNENTNH